MSERNWPAACQRLAAEVGGEVLKSKHGLLPKLSSMKSIEGVAARVKHWTITLGIFTLGGSGICVMVFTFMRAPYMSKDGFWFRVYRRGFLSELWKLIGMRNIEVGDPEFDRDFIIKGNNEAKIRALFANARIRNLLQSRSDIYCSVTRKWGREYELSFTEGKLITDVERLKLLFELFSETLHQLCRIGSAYQDS